MAYFTEKSLWENPIYSIDRPDPVMGGEHGQDNIAPKQLANRTRYLLDTFLKEHDKNGVHLLTEAQVNKLAAIAENKLQLDHSTTAIYERLMEATKILDGVKFQLAMASGYEGTSLRAIYDALMIAWTYGYPRFHFEMFTENFTLRDMFEDVPLEETIAGDDSIDVVDSSTVNEGETYVIWDRGDESRTRVVTVKHVLTEHRVILYEVKQTTRANSGVLTKCSWDIINGLAHATPESVFITGSSTLLDGFDRGNLIISHSKNVSFTVEYRYLGKRDPTVWHKLSLIERTWNSAAKKWRSRFETVGDSAIFKITCHGETTIDHMCLMTDIDGTATSTVRRPIVMGSDFQVSRFGALYNATHVGTHIQVSANESFTSSVVNILVEGFRDDPAPVWSWLDEVLKHVELQPGQELFWRVRDNASDGYWSAWSIIEKYTHTGAVNTPVDPIEPEPDPEPDQEEELPPDYNPDDDDWPGEEEPDDGGDEEGGDTPSEPAPEDPSFDPDRPEAWSGVGPDPAIGFTLLGKKTFGTISHTEIVAELNKETDVRIGDAYEVTDTNTIYQYTGDTWYNTRCIYGKVFDTLEYNGADLVTCDGRMEGKKWYYKNCIFDLRNIPNDAQDEAFSVVYGAHANLENCLILNSKKAILCGTGDSDDGGYGSLRMDNCVIINAGRRTPEAQQHYTVTMNNCWIHNWGVEEFDVRTFAVWAHDGAKITVNDCVFTRNSGLGDNNSKDIAEWIGWYTNEFGALNALTKERYGQSGTLRALETIGGGTIYAEHNYRNQSDFSIGGSTCWSMKRSEAEEVISKIEDAMPDTTPYLGRTLRQYWIDQNV